MPPWIRGWMVIASRGGDGWIWVLVGVVLTLNGKSDALKAGILAATLGVILFLTLKAACRRTRPKESKDWSKLFSPDRFSFPSGHTTTAFAVVMAVDATWPESAWWTVPLAVSVAVSRVLLGSHYLTDVLAGVGLGTVSGLVAAEFCKYF